jgi:hypothetical protein
MAGYASTTKTEVSNSEAEIKKTFNRFGVEDIIIGTIDGYLSVMFKRYGRPYSIRIALPGKDDDAILYTPNRMSKRNNSIAHKAWEQACRSKWRELLLLIKAKLVAIENGIASFDDEFLSYAMLPTRETVGDWANRQMEVMQQTGQLPDLIPQPALTAGIVEVIENG